MASDSIGWYLARVARYPLLTGAQEIMLARQLQSETGRVAARARRKLFLCNLRYVVSIAKKYAASTKFMQLEDLIQYGNIGLDRAISGFDPERGYKLSTYARAWITQSIIDGIHKDEYTIRMPQNRRVELRKIRRASAILMGKLGRVPSVEEIAKAVDLPVSLCELLAGHEPRPVSLDAELPGSGTIGDLIPAESTDGDEELDYGPLKLVPTLPERERIVVERHYGLMGYKRTPLSQIASDLGISRSMVTLIKTKALNRLRFNYSLMSSA